MVPAKTQHGILHVLTHANPQNHPQRAGLHPIAGEEFDWHILSSNKTMNAKLAAMVGMASLTTCTLMSGPLVVIRPPVVVVAPVVTVPAPAVTVVVGVPDDYVWDGTEYVGVVGDQYYYLGPDHVWLVMDAPRLARFHGWEKSHADWRMHAIRNEKYRRDAHGHDVPLRGMHAAPDAHPAPGSDHGHDAAGHHFEDDHHDH